MEKDNIKAIFNAFVMGSLKYAILCARPDICFVIGIMSGY